MGGDNRLVGVLSSGSLHERDAESVPLVALYNLVSKRKVLETVLSIMNAG